MSKLKERFLSEFEGNATNVWFPIIVLFLSKATLKVSLDVPLFLIVTSKLRGSPDLI